MNLSEPYEDWFCCLNPRESGALTLLAVSYFANSEYVTQAAYTIISFTTGLAALTIVNAYFIAHYGLTEGFVLDEEGDPIAVLFFDVEFWALFYAFTQTDAFFCPEPCAAFEFWV